MNRSFGYIYEKIEIKILILYILRRMPYPVTLETLTELAMCDGEISYFDFTECATALVATEHVTCIDNKYTITPKGVRNGTLTEKSLPYSIRERVDKSTSHARAAQIRNAQIKTDHRKKPDGTCVVKLSMSDGLGDVVKIELYAADEKQAMSLVRGFRENAESAYNALIEAINKK